MSQPPSRSLLPPVRKDPGQVIGPHDVAISVEFVANFEHPPPNHPGGRDFSLRPRIIALKNEEGAKIVIDLEHDGPADIEAKIINLIDTTLAGAGKVVVMNQFTRWQVISRGNPDCDDTIRTGSRLTNDMIRWVCLEEKIKEGTGLIRLQQDGVPILHIIPLGQNSPELAISTGPCGPAMNNTETVSFGFSHEKRTKSPPPLTDYLEHCKISQDVANASCKRAPQSQSDFFISSALT
ncbi:hypothetical protein KEM48_010895 [Puccinia striiformis f. sp. tritici PST-130]|nr:hypothetical protein Pst134EB_019954 [Puccinia striiformis f. sp. tritici]KAI9625415.1 hypothetical protein KEM48_010895 [Puccinia striiformis f. sp. tritici PST-130]